MDGFKLILIGDSGVGKTSLLKKYTTNKFSSSYQNTVGIEFITKDLKIESENITLQIWDTAGQEKFLSIINNFFINAACVFLVFSINERSTFDSIEKLYNNCKDKVLENCVYVLCGTKNDLEREVDYQDGIDLMKKYDLDLFFETSSKTGENVEKIFKESAKELIKNTVKINQLKNQMKYNHNSVKISDVEIIGNKKKKKCC